MHHIGVAIENGTGHAMRGCPWRVFDEPLVSDVLDAYPHLKAGNLGTFLGPHSSCRLLEAIGLYDRTLSRLLEDERRKMEERAEADASATQAMMGMHGVKRG